MNNDVDHLMSMDRFDPDLWVYIPDVMALNETERALLVRIDGKSEWIPKSAIHDDSEVWRSGDIGSLILASWKAEEIGQF